MQTHIYEMFSTINSDVGLHCLYADLSVQILEVKIVFSEKSLIEIPNKTELYKQKRLENMPYKVHLYIPWLLL